MVARWTDYVCFLTCKVLFIVTEPELKVGRGFTFLHRFLS